MKITSYTIMSCVDRPTNELDEHCQLKNKMTTKLCNYIYRFSFSFLFLVCRYVQFGCVLFISPMLFAVILVYLMRFLLSLVIKNVKTSWNRMKLMAEVFGRRKKSGKTFSCSVFLFLLFPFYFDVFLNALLFSFNKIVNRIRCHVRLAFCSNPFHFEISW